MKIRDLALAVLPKSRPCRPYSTRTRAPFPFAQAFKQYIHQGERVARVDIARCKGPLPSTGPASAAKVR